MSAVPENEVIKDATSSFLASFLSHARQADHLIIKVGRWLSRVSACFCRVSISPKKPWLRTRMRAVRSTTSWGQGTFLILRLHGLRLGEMLDRWES